MTDKLELKSCHEVIDTVDVADVESIFHGKPIDPDILTVVMKDGKRLYCDEVCPIDSLKEESISKHLNIESMIESYKQRLISQANGVKNSPFVNMCLASYKHGINETLDTLNLSNVQRTIKNRKEPVSADWFRNNVWHKPDEKPSDKSKVVVWTGDEMIQCHYIYGKFIEKTPTEECGYNVDMKSSEGCGNVYVSKKKRADLTDLVEKWAYIDDLLKM